MMEDLALHSLQTQATRSRRCDAPAIALRQLDMERYLDNTMRFEQGAGEKVPVVSLRRRSYLFCLIALICEVAVVDTANLLPAGIFFYAISFVVAIEQITSNGAVPNDVLWREQIRQQQQEELRRRYELATFEYKVLRKSNAKIIPVEENGVTKLYAV